MSIYTQMQTRTVVRTAPDIYRGLSCGRIDPASLHEMEKDALKHHCRHLVRKWSMQVVEERRRGRTRIARRHQRHLFESLASRLVAAWQADRKARRRQRRQQRKQGKTPISARTNFVHVWRVAERLKNVHAPASVVVYTEPKPKGGFRLLCSPDLFGVAKQQLFVNAVKPFASFHPSQFALKGRSAACKSLLQAMNEPGILNARFVQFDVVDFFPSISREYVEEVVPAPKGVIRSTLFMDNWRITFKGVGNAMDRRGLPQGLAASSLVAEMVMANVLRDIADRLPELHCVHAYSDNWGGFVPHDKDVNELVGGVRRAFEAHPAGPYSITCETQDAGQSFKFLGYYNKPASEGQCARVSLPKRLAMLKELELTYQLAEAENMRDVLKVLDRLLSFCSAYSLAPETQKLGRRICRLAFGELQYQQRSLSVD